MARRQSDYNVFVSARMRALSPHGLDESRQAMQQVAAEWRAMKGRSPNPSSVAIRDGSANPRRRRMGRARRSNPAGMSLPTLAVMGGLAYLVLRHRASSGSAPIATLPASTTASAPTTSTTAAASGGGNGW